MRYNDKKLKEVYLLLLTNVQYSIFFKTIKFRKLTLCSLENVYQEVTKYTLKINYLKLSNLTLIVFIHTDLRNRSTDFVI